ncbi:MAG: cytochrome c [Actinomycetia bacterium]|nr:cytochrome c [Actinomycetes bacterium]MCP4962178.1 cytochrome c [Actinomycetes bacterium]
MAGYKYQGDDELNESTNMWMLWGGVLMLAMVVAFPLYRWVESDNRETSLEETLESFASTGEELWGDNCASCHGPVGEGLSGPALNSEEFLQAATDAQIIGLTSTGVPGSPMSAYSQEHGGPLTSDQIRALQVFIRNWEPTAPSVPGWRDMVGG